MKKAIKAFIFALFFVFDMWVLLSIADIAAHNLDAMPEYNKANFFCVITREDINADQT